MDSVPNYSKIGENFNSSEKEIWTISVGSRTKEEPELVADTHQNNNSNDQCLDYIRRH